MDKHFKGSGMSPSSPTHQMQPWAGSPASLTPSSLSEMEPTSAQYWRVSKAPGEISSLHGIITSIPVLLVNLLLQPEGVSQSE